MQIRILPFVESEEHPLDRVVTMPLPARRGAVSSGDVVLFRTPQGQVAPARLVVSAGGGCWLARDARHTRGLIYLDPESILSRLPQTDLIGEAA